MAAKKKTKQKPRPFDALIEFLKAQPKVLVGKKLSPSDKKLAPLLALAKKHDARVHEFMKTLVSRPVSFGVFDVEAYGEYLLRGKKGEEWNAGEKVIGPLDVCIARNGAGDPYAWNAKTGEVRMLVHDESWSESVRYDDVDAFVEEVMREAVESAYVDQLEEDTPDHYVACLRFAIEVAGDDGLDDDVRAKLTELEEA